MAKRYTDEFRRDAVRMATTSGLTQQGFTLKIAAMNLIGTVSLPQKDLPNLPGCMSCCQMVAFFKASAT